MHARKPYKLFVSKFTSKDIQQVMKSHMTNPSVSGSTSADVRMRDAAGSDTAKNRKLSPMATPFGASWVKSRNEPKFPERE